MQERLQAQLGIVVRILPSDNEVRTTRGIFIQLDEQPGLCRKTRSAIPAAIRRSFDNRPEIVYALLNERDLLAGAPERADSTTARSRAGVQRLHAGRRAPRLRAGFHLLAAARG